jgi:ferredoxin
LRLRRALARLPQHERQSLLCRDCGACADVCPTNALFAEILPQSTDDLEREAELAALDEKIKLL